VLLFLGSFELPAMVKMTHDRVQRTPRAALVREVVIEAFVTAAFVVVAVSAPSGGTALFWGLFGLRTAAATAIYFRQYQSIRRGDSGGGTASSDHWLRIAAVGLGLGAFLALLFSRHPLS
jgi:hypothetical protein